MKNSNEQNYTLFCKRAFTDVLEGVKLYPPFFLPQQEDKSDPSNYRPIAITFPISKIMETIITKHLLAFLETTGITFDKPDLLTVHNWYSALQFYEKRVEGFLLIFPRALLTSGTKVYLQTANVWSPPHFIGLILSAQVYLWAQMSLLCCSSSS